MAKKKENTSKTKVVTQPTPNAEESSPTLRHMTVSEISIVPNADASDAVKRTTSTFSDALESNVQARRNIKARKLLESLGVEDVSFDKYGLFDTLATSSPYDDRVFSLLDEETVPNKRLVQQVAAAVRHALNRDTGYSTFLHEEDGGEFSWKFLIRKLDYERFHRKVNFPIGSVYSLTSTNSQRLRSLMQMIINRMQTIASFPYDDAIALVAALPRDNGLQDLLSLMASSGIEDINIPSDESTSPMSLEAIANMLRRLTGQALAKYVSDSLIRPAFRHEAVHRTNLIWLSPGDILDRAYHHIRWQYMSKMGIIQTTARSEIFNVLSRDAAVSGLSNLVTASVDGVKSNAIYALAELTDAVAEQTPDIYATVMGLDASKTSAAELKSKSPFKYTIATDEASGATTSIQMAISGAIVDRHSRLLDIKGDPALIEDDYQSVDGSEGIFDVPTVDDIAACVRILCAMKEIDVFKVVDLSRLTVLSDWANALLTDVTSNVVADLRADIESVPRYIKNRLEFEFFTSILDGKVYNSPLARLFTDSNAADINSLTVENLGFYSLASEVLRRLIVEYLSIARTSREWSTSAIWGILADAGIFSASDLAPTFKTHVTKRLIPTYPVLAHTRSGLTAARYFLADGVVDFSPAISPVIENIKQLGVMGRMTYDVSLVGNFTLDVPVTFVDVYSLWNTDALSPFDKHRLLQGLKPYDAQTINAFSSETGKKLSVCLFDYRRADDSAHTLLEGTALMVQMQPQVVARFSGLNSLDCIPMKLLPLYKESLAYKENEKLIDARLLPLIKVYDPSAYLHVVSDSFSIDADFPSMLFPTTGGDLHTLIRKIAPQIEMRTGDESQQSGETDSDD